jgi:hydrogenase maturation protease
MKTLILGIGNLLLGDDGIGVHITKELAREIEDKNIDIEDAGTDGLNLLELVAGYDRLIVIDAIMTEDGEIGEVYRLKLEDLAVTVQPTASPHHANLASTVELGKKLLPEQMPGEVIIFAVGIQEVTGFTEEMTRKVEEAVPVAVNLILEEIEAA